MVNDAPGVDIRHRFKREGAPLHFPVWKFAQSPRPQTRTTPLTTLP